MKYWRIEERTVQCRTMQCNVHLREVLLQRHQPQLLSVEVEAEVGGLVGAGWHLVTQALRYRFTDSLRHLVIEQVTDALIYSGTQFVKHTGTHPVTSHLSLCDHRLQPELQGDTFQTGEGRYLVTQPT